MRCTLDRSIFVSELDFLAPVLKDRPIQPPSLSLTVNDGRLTAASYDGRIDLRSSVPVSNAQPGTCSVRGGIVRSMTKLLPKGPVSLRVVGGDRLQMTWADGEASFPHVAKSLLRPVTVTPSVDMVMPASTLGDMLAAVAFAVDAESYSNRIPGVLLERLVDGMLRVVATDGYSLAVAERMVESSEQVAQRESILLPCSSIESIRAMLAGQTVRMVVSGDDFQVTCGSRVLTMRAASGAFPKYELIIPKVSGHGATLHAGDLRDTVQRVLVGGDDEYSQVTLSFTTDNLTVTADGSSEALSCLYAGQSFVVRLDAKKLRGLLGGFKAERITMFTENPKHPQLFQPAGNSSLRLVLAPVSK